MGFDPRRVFQTHGTGYDPLILGLQRSGHSSSCGPDFDGDRCNQEMKRDDCNMQSKFLMKIRPRVGQTAILRLIRS